MPLRAVAVLVGGLFGGLLAVDGFATFFKVIFLVVAMLTVLMSHRYLDIERVSPGEYQFLILCATLGMMVMAAEKKKTRRHDSHTMVAWRD